MAVRYKHNLLLHDKSVKGPKTPRFAEKVQWNLSW